MLSADVLVCGRCGYRFVTEPTVIPPPPPLPDVPYQTPSAPGEVAPKQKVVAVSLALGLGGIGAHGFYLGNNVMGFCLAVMFVGGGMAASILYIMFLAGACSIWFTAIGLGPLLLAATIPLIQAACYGAANAERFHQRYVVEKRWF